MTPKRIDEKLDEIHQKILDVSIHIAEARNDIKHFDRRVSVVENHWKITKWVMTVVAAITSVIVAKFKGHI